MKLLDLGQERRLLRMSNAMITWRGIAGSGEEGTGTVGTAAWKTLPVSARLGRWCYAPSRWPPEL